MNDLKKLVNDLDHDKIKEAQDRLAIQCEHEDNDDTPLNQDELFSLIESDEYEPGLARACGDIGEPDEVDTAIHLWIGKLSEIYEDADAQQAVFDALSDLCEKNHLSEPPPVHSEMNEKREWISIFDQLIDVKLRSMGLEF